MDKEKNDRAFKALSAEDKQKVLNAGIKIVKNVYPELANKTSLIKNKKEQETKSKIKN